MKKSLLIIGAVAILGILAVYAVPLSAKKTTSTSNALNSSTTTTTATVSQVAATTTAASTPTISTALTSSTSSLKDGSYVGSSSSNPYGDTQIKLIISGGKITDVTTTVYPSNNRHSLQISQYSIPQLKQEVLAAQSASIDSISGASYTSQSYAESIQAALNQAKA